LKFCSVNPSAVQVTDTTFDVHLAEAVDVVRVSVIVVVLVDVGGVVPVEALATNMDIVRPTVALLPCKAGAIVEAADTVFDVSLAAAVVDAAAEVEASMGVVSPTVALLPCSAGVVVEAAVMVFDVRLAAAVDAIRVSATGVGIVDIMEVVSPTVVLRLTEVEAI
jgi:hypothetical protein